MYNMGRTIYFDKIKKREEITSSHDFEREFYAGCQPRRPVKASVRRRNHLRVANH